MKSESQHAFVEYATCMVFSTQTVKSLFTFGFTFSLNFHKYHGNGVNGYVNTVFKHF